VGAGPWPAYKHAYLVLALHSHTHLIIAEHLCLQQELVHQCGLAVIDMGDDRDVAQILALCSGALGGRGGGCAGQ